MNLSQVFKSAPSVDNTRAIPGAVFNFLSMVNEANDRPSLIRIVVKSGAEPPAHTHSREDESYYIINGRIRYTVGDEVITTQPGEYIFLPKNVPHKFEVLTPEAEVLMWLSPAGLDQWFWDNSMPAPSGEPLPSSEGPPPSHVIENFVNSLRAYGVEMV